MAPKRVIAYFMHESEQHAAVQAMTSPESTDSFVIGDLDEGAIEGLRKQGLIVQIQPDLIQLDQIVDAQAMTAEGFSFAPDQAGASRRRPLLMRSLLLSITTLYGCAVRSWRTGGNNSSRPGPRLWTPCLTDLTGHASPANVSGQSTTFHSS